MGTVSGKLYLFGQRKPDEDFSVRFLTLYFRMSGLAKGQQFLAVLSLQDLAHGAVDGGQAAEDALKAGDGGDGVVAGEITQSQQHEQHGQGAEDHLGSLVVLQGADEHEGGEDAPQQQIPAHGDLAGGFDTGFGEGIDPDQHQAPPEQAVGGECGAGEGIALLHLEDAGNDLSQTAQGDTHGDDGDGQGQQICVVQVQQHGGHAEAQQTQRAGIGGFGCGCRHDSFLHFLITFSLQGKVSKKASHVS